MKRLRIISAAFFCVYAKKVPDYMHSFSYLTNT